MPTEYKQILVAVDGSPEAELALAKSINIAKQNTAALSLIYVVDVRSYSAMTKRVPDLDDEILEYGRELLEKYKKQAEAAGVSSVTVFVTTGSPKKVISRDYANQIEADLIVCGAQGLNALEKYLMGSVSQHIVSNSSCDVLVVRKPKTAAAQK